MKLARRNKLSFLEPNWLGPGVVAGVTTRNGGVSRSPYNSLNLAFNTEDMPAHIEGNRATVAKTFGLPSHLLLTVKQVHGNDLLLVDAPNLDLGHFSQVESDAIITNQPGILIGILVADCYPVLLYDAEHHVVAAVHAGWRGAANGLIGKTITAMRQHFGSQPKALKVAVGPGIGAHRYEVDRPVRDAFRNGTDHWGAISEETRLGHWKLDLRESCRLQLLDAGLEPSGIDVASECTCCHRELFFSYRRDDGKTGRQLGYVGLLET